MVINWAYGDAKLSGRIAQDRNIGRLYSWIAGDKDDLFRLYCQSFRIATLLLIASACIRLLRRKEIHGYQFLYILSLFGGILFYCFWEIKESYSVQFVYIMLLIAVYGGEALQKKTTAVSNVICSPKQSMVVVAGFSCLLLFCAMMYHGLSVEQVKQKDYSVRTVSTLTRGAIDTGEPEETIEQEFYAQKAFNKISLYVSADDEGICVYQAVLMDESGTELFSGDISSEGINGKEYVVLSTGQIRPDGKQKYTLKLVRNKESIGKMVFNYRCTPYVDMYDGICRVNNECSPYDLLLQVYHEQKIPFCSGKMGLMICGGFFCFVLVLYLWMRRISSCNC